MRGWMRFSEWIFVSLFLKCKTTSKVEQKVKLTLVYLLSLNNYQYFTKVVSFIIICLSYPLTHTAHV